MNCLAQSSTLLHSKTNNSSLQQDHRRSTSGKSRLSPHNVVLSCWVHDFFSSCITTTVAYSHGLWGTNMFTIFLQTLCFHICYCTKNMHYFRMDVLLSIYCFILIYSFKLSKTGFCLRKVSFFIQLILFIIKVYCWIIICFPRVHVTQKYASNSIQGQIVKKSFHSQKRG